MVILVQVLKTSIIKKNIKNIICHKCKEICFISSEIKIFYKFFICNKNLCPQCIFQHDRNHKIID